MTQAQLYLAAFLIIQSSLAFAGALENLDATLSKANSVESFLGNAELKAKYKKAVDAFTGNEDFNCRSVANNFRELDVLQSQVHGFSEKMFKATATPAQFEVDGMKITQVPRPFHAVWLTKATEGCAQRACTEKDKILRDPYTAALDGTKFFIVEKAGKFTGSSITVLPVKRDKERFYLVMENDATGVLKPETLNKFLDKMKRLSKRTVLAVKLNKNKADTYYSFDGEPYFPLSEVKLEDPRAEQIFLAVGRRCGNGTGKDGAEVSSGLSEVSTLGAVPAAGAPTNNNANSNSNANNFLANLTINNQTGEISKELSDQLKNDPKGLQSKLQDISKNAPDSATRDKAKDLLNFAKTASADPGAYPIMPEGSVAPVNAARSPASISSPNIKLGGSAKAVAGAAASGAHTGAGAAAGGVSAANGDFPGGPGFAGNGIVPGNNTSRARGLSGSGSGSGGNATAIAGTQNNPSNPSTPSTPSKEPSTPGKINGGSTSEEAGKSAKNQPKASTPEKSDKPGNSPAAGAGIGIGNAAISNPKEKDGNPSSASTDLSNVPPTGKVWEDQASSLVGAVGDTLEQVKKKIADYRPDKDGKVTPRFLNPADNSVFNDIDGNSSNPEYVRKTVEDLRQISIENPNDNDVTELLEKMAASKNPETRRMVAEVTKRTNQCYCKNCNKDENGKRCCTPEQIVREQRDTSCN